MKLTSWRICSFGLAACAAIGMVGCGGDSDVESMLNPKLIGTWKLASVAAGANKVTCPGSGELVAGRTFECGANETLNLKSDGTYDELLTSTTEDSGDWFAIDTHLMMDDELGVNNPIAYTFVLEGNLLLLETYEGGFIAEYVREGEESTLTDEDIVASNPDLAIENLVDPNMVGKWRYRSIEYNGTIIQCPGDTGIEGFSCGDNEWIEFSNNNKFTETVSSTTHDSGFWYARLNRVYMEDLEFHDHDPSAATYVIENGVMTMRMWGGVYNIVMERIE